MNFLPIFKYRLKDDMKAVGVFLIVTLLCMVLVVYGIMIMVSEINDRVVSNFSMALTMFSFVIGIVTVREDLRLGIQNGVSRGTSLAACFTANVVASLAAALGVTFVEWLSAATQEATNATLVSFYAMIYGEDLSLSGQLRSFLLSFVWSGSAVFVGSFLSLLYWRADEAVALDSVPGHGRGAHPAAERRSDKRRVHGQSAGFPPLAGRGPDELGRVPHRCGGRVRRLRLAPDPPRPHHRRDCVKKVDKRYNQGSVVGRGSAPARRESPPLTSPQPPCRGRRPRRPAVTVFAGVTTLRQPLPRRGIISQ